MNIYFDDLVTVAPCEEVEQHFGKGATITQRTGRVKGMDLQGRYCVQLYGPVTVHVPGCLLSHHAGGGSRGPNPKLLGDNDA